MVGLGLPEVFAEGAGADFTIVPVADDLQINFTELEKVLDSIK